MATTVGIRDLRAGLSRFLKRVRAGETIDVTDHGETIARIIPVGIPEDLARLMADGTVRWSGQRFVPPRRPIVPKRGAPLASDVIAEDRR